MLPGQFQPALPERPSAATEHVLRRQDAFHRVLSFTGKTIDDVVNCPIARREVLGYFKLHRWVQRRCDVVELERQWNPLMGTVTRPANPRLTAWASPPAPSRVRRPAS